MKKIFAAIGSVLLVMLNIAQAKFIGKSNIKNQIPISIVGEGGGENCGCVGGNTQAK